jgi:CheY-like chemotaxis protein
MIKDTPKRKLKILIVDDDRLVAESEGLMLERLGHEVTVHTDSPEALQAFTQDPQAYDLIITDQVMPKMTGTMLALEIFRVRPDMPIILVTGYADAVQESQVKALGIRNFIRKPFGSKDLSDLIDKAIALKQSLTPADG